MFSWSFRLKNDTNHQSHKMPSGLRAWAFDKENRASTCLAFLLFPPLVRLKQMRPYQLGAFLNCIFNLHFISSLRESEGPEEKKGASLPILIIRHIFEKITDQSAWNKTSFLTRPVVFSLLFVYLL